MAVYGNILLTESVLDYKISKIEKNIKKLGKQAEKLKKKIEKSKNPEETKKLENELKDIEKQIEKLEKDKRKIELEKRCQEEMFIVDEMIEINKNKRITDQSKEAVGLFLTYYNISDSELIKMIGSCNKCLKNIIDPKDEYGKDLSKLLIKQFELKDFEDKSIAVLADLDDTLTLFSSKTKKFYFGDWEAYSNYIHNISDLRSIGKKLLATDEMKEVIEEYGLNK